VGSRKQSFVIHSIFFFSGAAGLIYEVVWARLLREVFGVTAHAVAAVLATYLGGLALGAWLLGRMVDRREKPLRLYGQLELGVALFALLGMPLLRFFEPINAAAASRLAPDSFVLAAIRLALSSLLILPPTFLMGATLPAMTRAMVPRISSLGRELGFLYALNTAGAVAGCLCAGWFLIRTIGVHPTLWVAAGLNLAVGLTALITPSEAQAVSAEEAVSKRKNGVLIAVGLGGIASIALEVIWTRVLVLVLGGSTHAFVTMLAVFLTGISLGSFLLRLFVDKLRDPRRAFGFLQGLIALSVLATIPLMGLLVIESQQWLHRNELHWVQILLARFGISAAIMLLPTTLIGMSFPLAARLHVGSVEELGSGLGQVYGANTLGNIAGAVLGGFVLLPLVGMDRGLVLLTALNFAAAGWGLWPKDAASRWITGSVFAVSGASVLTMILFWHPAPFRSIEESPGDRALFYEEGLISTVKVLQRADDGEQRVMLVDNVRIGQSARGVDYKQQALAHFPFLLGKDVRKAITIGLGTGITAGEIARHPSLEKLTCVELSPSVIKGARFFDEFNGDVQRNPKVRIVNDDGFSYLKRSGEKFDAIISDGKSQLGEAGNSTFFSTEFYNAAREHLGPGGSMIQWMPLDEMPRDLKTIARTFMGSFAHSYLWFGHNSLFLVGRQEPLQLDLDHMQDELDAPAMEHLRRHGWRSAIDLIALMVADGASAQSWLAGESTVNSLEQPVLEFYSMRALATRSKARVAENVRALAATRAETLRHFRLQGPDGEALGASARSVGLLMDAIQLRAEPKNTAAASALLIRASLAAPEQGAVRESISHALEDAAADEDREGNSAAAIDVERAALAAFPDNLGARLSLASGLASIGREMEAMDHLRLALALNPKLESAHEMMGALLLHIDPPKAMPHLLAARELAPDFPSVREDLGRAFDAAGKPREALESYREAIRLQPDWPVPMADAAMLLASDASLGDPHEAVALAARANTLMNEGNADVLQILGLAYHRCGRSDQAVEAQRKAIALLHAANDQPAQARAEAQLARYTSAR
jgi:spermidine synthase